MDDKSATDESVDNETTETSELAAELVDVAGQARRVKFYSVSDLSVGWEAPRAAEVARAFDEAVGVASVGDALELVNVLKFIDLGLVTASLSEEDRGDLLDRVSTIRGAIARFFRSVDESTVGSVLVDVPINYRADLLEELARQRAFDRCAAASMVSGLFAAECGVSVTRRAAG